MTQQVKKHFTTEVIMAAYNNERFTRATLNGFTRQSTKDFSITIADDGSNKSTGLLANEFQNTLNIRHIWHEDKGYRRALILNKAIATSKADYIIFIDNDCIPHKHFIKDHVMSAAVNQSVTGRRVNLGKEISIEIISNFYNLAKIENPFFLLYLILRKKLRDGERGFHLPRTLSKIPSRKKRGLLGSNMAVWRKDLININGFDSSFTGYGSEETDLQWRLEANNIQIQSLINRAIQFHLYHEQKIVTNTNIERIHHKMKKNLTISPSGINEAYDEIIRDEILRDEI